MKTNIVKLLMLAGISIFLGISAGCEPAGYGAQFSNNPEGTGAPPAPLPPSIVDPLNPPLPPPPGNPTTYTDDFSQGNATAKADIVWVIDSSGSMGDDQQELSANASTFTGKLQSANVNFQL